jgi:hypothetical protein
MIAPVSNVLRQALEPVLRDIRTSGMPEPEVRDGDWMEDPDVASAWLCSDDGSVVGIRVTVAASEPDQIMEAADQVQDWVINELLGTSATNWPPCPNHPETHPLMASTRERVAVWVCPTDGTPFSPLGELPSPHDSSRA